MSEVSRATAIAEATRRGRMNALLCSGGMNRDAMSAERMCQTTLLLEQLLQPRQHRRPVLLGLLLRLRRRVLVLRKGNCCAVAAAGELDRHRVVVLRSIRLAGERAEVAVAKHPLWLEREDHALVLVALSLPFALPDDRAAFLERRGHLRPEHVLLDLGRVHQRVPDSRRRRCDGRRSLRDVVHGYGLRNRKR